MGTLLVHFAEDVEEKGVHVKIEGLVVQKKLGQQTQVLAVDFVLGAVHLEHRNGAFAVNFVSWGLPHRTFALQFIERTLINELLLFFFFWGTLFSRKLYLKNFNIKNKDNKISQGRGNSLRNIKLSLFFTRDNKSFSCKSLRLNPILKHVWTTAITVLNI